MEFRQKQMLHENRLIQYTTRVMRFGSLPCRLNSKPVKGEKTHHCEPLINSSGICISKILTLHSNNSSLDIVVELLVNNLGIFIWNHWPKYCAKLVIGIILLLPLILRIFPDFEWHDQYWCGVLTFLFVFTKRELITLKKRASIGKTRTVGSSLFQSFSL